MTQEHPDAEDEMAQAVEQALAQPAPEAVAPAAPPPRTNGAAGSTELSLVDQLTRIENINQQLRERIRTERMALQHELENRQRQIRAAFDREAHKAIAELERKRDNVVGTNPLAADLPLALRRLAATFDSWQGDHAIETPVEACLHGK